MLLTKTISVSAKFSDISTVCDNYLKFETDYIWDSDRTTLASDFDKVCKKTDLSFLDSLYFVGGTIGLCVGKSKHYFLL